MNTLKAIAAVFFLSAAMSLQGQGGIDPQLLAKARSGDAGAQIQVGDSYAKGQGVPQDYAEALRWWRMAADRGNAAAQNKIGIAYNQGQGVPKDYGQAIVWFRKAAEQGNAVAQANLGVSYDEGIGIDEDHAQAVEWFRKSADQGWAQGENRLGMSYYRGLGVRQDYTAAFAWFLKAANQSFLQAEMNVADTYHTGHGVAQDEAQAFSWYRKAADQGDLHAQNEVGDRYHHGLGVPQDDVQAVDWFRKAAEKGNANAQANLGDMYYLGHGVKQDYAQAITWYQRAADQGNAHSKALLPMAKQQGATNGSSARQDSPGTPARPTLTPQAIAKIASDSTVVIVSSPTKKPSPPDAQNAPNAPNGTSVASPPSSALLGSGFAVGPDLVVTNSHILPEGYIGFVSKQGSQDVLLVQANVIRDTEDDIALLHVPGLNLPPLLLAAQEPVAGDTVYAMGNPQGMVGTFSEGVVSAVRHLKSYPVIQFTAPISHGSSGGPVFNVNGEVIGIATSLVASGENLNFAISGNRCPAQTQACTSANGWRKASPRSRPRCDAGGTRLERPDSRLIPPCRFCDS